MPRGLPTRRERQRPGQGVPLVRVPRTLPQILDPAEVDALTAALRTHRDRAMVAAMVLGGLRRCEVLGLRLGDLRFGERRLFIAEGKGGHQRLVPVSPRFFTEVSAYLDAERPAGTAADAVFVVLKGPRRGMPLSAAGLDEILDGARRRAGLAHATCHQLRHTCLTQAAQSRDERWRRCRPRPGTPRSSPPAFTCTWAMTGWPPSTAGPPRPSTPRPSPHTARRVPGDRAGAAARLGADRRGHPGHRRPDAPLPGAGRLRAAAGQRQRRRPGAALVRRVPGRGSPRRPRRWPRSPAATSRTSSPGWPPGPGRTSRG